MKNPAPQLAIHLLDDAVEASAKRVFLNVGPWGGSAFLHVGCLLLLLLWHVPISTRGSLELTAFTGVGDNELDELSFDMEATIEQPVTQLETAADFTTTEIKDTAVELDESRLLEVVDPNEEKAELVAEPVPTMAAISNVAQPTIGSRGTLHGAATIEEAVDRITGGIRGYLEHGDLLVVWLLDSSRSLEADRSRVANRLGVFLRDVGEGQDGSHRLLNAVVAFGEKVSERVGPTDSARKVLHAIDTTPVDTSGKEYVFRAVDQSVMNYRQKWKKQMMIVIWTDESGDDASQLEQTIQRCVRAEVPVSVIGPSAVLGAVESTDDYLDPKTGKVFALPVSRGPDAALPERIRVGYWHQVRGPGGVDTDQHHGFPTWYGGQDLAGLLSGFSPYALTRLSLATGGSFTIFDRPDERPPFDLERMQEYLPFYGPAQAYWRDIASHPLRLAVMEAVKSTYGSDSLEAPELRFFGRSSPVPPHQFEAFYFTPEQFTAQLRASKGRLLRAAQHAAMAIEFALKQVSEDGHTEHGLPEEYEREESPRWRAWYDLTRGRLLAASVRWREYRLLCEQFGKRDFLESTTNCIRLTPSTTLRCEDASFTYRAEEAVELLQRCVRDHPETPWAYLAQRELAHGLGLSVQQLQLSPTGAVNADSAPELPKF